MNRSKMKQVCLSLLFIFAAGLSVIGYTFIQNPTDAMSTAIKTSSYLIIIIALFIALFGAVFLTVIAPTLALFEGEQEQ